MRLLKKLIDVQHFGLQTDYSLIHLRFFWAELLSVKVPAYHFLTDSIDIVHVIR